MARSAVVPAKRAMLAMLQALPTVTADGVQVEWSHPGSKFLQRESIYMLRTTAAQEPGALGRRSRDERATVEVVFYVSSRGGESEDAEARVWTLVGEFEDALREDATLGDLVLVAHVERIDVEVFPGTGERVAEGVVTVEVQSRL